MSDFIDKAVAWDMCVKRSKRAADLATMLRSVRVSEIGGDTYISLFVEGRGFCSGKVTPEFRALAMEWESMRQAALPPMSPEQSDKERA